MIYIVVRETLFLIFQISILNCVIGGPDLKFFSEENEMRIVDFVLFFREEEEEQH